jgi:hypothetical protein
MRAHALRSAVSAPRQYVRATRLPGDDLPRERANYVKERVSPGPPCPLHGVLAAMYGHLGSPAQHSTSPCRHGHESARARSARSHFVSCRAGTMGREHDALFSCRAGTMARRQHDGLSVPCQPRARRHTREAPIPHSKSKITGSSNIAFSNSNRT